MYLQQNCNNFGLVQAVDSQQYFLTLNMKYSKTKYIIKIKLKTQEKIFYYKLSQHSVFVTKFNVNSNSSGNSKSRYSNVAITL